MDLHISFMRVCTSLVATLFFYPYAATDDNTYSWQPVLQNMRVRDGDYQILISNEGVCKTRCVENQDCIGVDWDAGRRSCFLLSGSGASPYSANGYRHWRITRNRSTPTINQDNTYSWQPVQQNMRLRNGDYQILISNEEVCKTRCVADQNCIGVDWDAGRRSCFLLSDSGASPYSANGYRHWRIIRSRSTSIINQGTPSQTTTTTIAATAAATSRITSPKKITTATASIIHNNIHAEIANKSVISKELLARRTLDTSTLKTETTSVRNGISSFTEDSSSVTSGLTLRSEKSSSRQPRDIANEDIDADLVPRLEAQLHPTTPASVHYSSSENWITVLSVLLGISTLVVAGLMCNTWRLQQKIRSCTCDLKKANFLHQAQANGYQSYEGPVNPPTVYTDIARTLPPIPTDNEIVYADIDDSLRQ